MHFGLLKHALFRWHGFRGASRSKVNQLRVLGPQRQFIPLHCMLPLLQQLNTTFCLNIQDLILGKN